MDIYATDIDAIHAAAVRIAGSAHRTPVSTCATLDALAGRQLFFKCEHLQKVGAFKFRGATNAVARLTDTQARNGVVTHSSGNHAQALALAARLRGIAAHIVMPRHAPAVKRQAVHDYGARIYPCEPTLVARESMAAEVAAATGTTFIHPYDNADVIAGQGTAALELLEQVPELDAIIAPVGGGGLLAGTCIAARSLTPSLRLFGAEPAGADDAARSLACGLLTGLGELTWPIVRDHVDAVITVTDVQIVAAMRVLWERAKLLVEPSAAVPVAAMLSPQMVGSAGLERVGVILSGGNVDVGRLPF